MNNYSKERKHLIGLIAYRFSEMCSNAGVDGLWISYMVAIVEKADNYDFTHALNEDGTINTDIVYCDVDCIAASLLQNKVN